MSKEHDLIKAYTLESARVVASLTEQTDLIVQIGQTVASSLLRGGKLLTAGNGGSAAEAMHLCEELTGNYRHHRKAFPAICFNADGTALTCIANDWDFNSIFSRQAEAFTQPGDVFIGFTTSGNSENILRAMAAVKARGGTNIGLLGRGGGKARNLCDLALVVASDKSNHIQEAHQAVMHMILEQVENALEAIPS